MHAKNVIGGTFEDLNEAVVRPVSDEVGKALEQGVQNVFQGQKQPVSGSQPEETQAKLLEARRKIKWWKDLSDAQRRVREGKNQAQAQQQQAVQDKKQVKQFEVSKKQQKNIALVRSQRKTEIKGGVGG